MLMMARQAKRRMLRKEGTSTLQHMTPPKMRAQVRFSSECDRMYRLLLAAMTWGRQVPASMRMTDSPEPGRYSK